MICFIILNYIDYLDTIKTTNEIMKINGNKSIIIVDNCSPNDSFNNLKKTFNSNQCVSVLKAKSNLGFARGNNLGYRYALEKFKPKFIVVLNSDIQIDQNDLITRINNSYSKNRFDIMGPDIITISEGKHQNPLNIEFPTLSKLVRKRNRLLIKVYLKPLYWVRWRLFSGLNNQKKKQNASKDKVKEVTFNVPLHGSFYVFSKKFINENKLGCFYPKTFMYMEAEILYWQSHYRNYKMIYDPSVIVHHVDDASTDMTFTNRFDKAVFSNRSLLKSTNVFIKLIKNNKILSK